MTKSRVVNASEQLEISPHMLETFAKAEELIRKTYGKSPPPETLMRMWMLSATSLSLIEEFEEAVMEIDGSDSAKQAAIDGSLLTL